MKSAERLRSAAQALLRAGREWMRADGQVIVTEPVQMARLQLCANCPNRAEDQCGLCHCYLFAKSALTTETCPAGKWGAP